MPNQTLPFDQALATVLAHAAALPTPAATETLPLLDTLHRTLATPVLANRDQPPFDRSTRDGYAVRYADLPKPLQLVGSLRAGECWAGAPLAPGQAIEIMTGAPIPPGADSVLMVEHTALSDTTLHPHPDRTLRPGENIVPRAAEARAGQTILPRGRRLGPAELAVAASCGLAHLTVFPRPSVAIVATGDELVELDQRPADHQIHNSNSYALAALVHEAGGNPIRLPIARDTLDDLRARLHEARSADLILLSGGVSMGKYDLVEQILAELGAEFFFTGALIQPGKPIVFGQLLHASPTPYSLLPTPCFFGLPGNPISTQVCFHLFVVPLLRALAGRTDLAPQFVEATLAEDVPGGARVTRFLPAELTGSVHQATVRLTGWQGSGDLAANARGNAYVVLPANTPHHPAGQAVRVLLR
jgi:molybdopterin molybdotransferase